MDPWQLDWGPFFADTAADGFFDNGGAAQGDWQRGRDAVGWNDDID